MFKNLRNGEKLQSSDKRIVGAVDVPARPTGLAFSAKSVTMSGDFGDAHARLPSASVAD